MAGEYPDPGEGGDWERKIDDIFYKKGYLGIDKARVYIVTKSLERIPYNKFQY